jgi:hypothetical protein
MNLARTLSRSCLLAAMAAVLTAPALAQKPEDRPPKRLSEVDMAVIKDAVNTVAKDGECNAVYTVGKDSRPKDIKPNCTVPDYDSWVVKAIESMTFQSEIMDGESFDTKGFKQPFIFKAPVRVVAAAPVTPAATVIKSVEPKEINRIITRVNKAGNCDVTLTVGADGKPKNIQPNCTPDAYNGPITKAVEKVRYQPVMKDGKAVELPGVKLPINLSLPNQ